MQMFLMVGGLSSVAPPQAAYFLGCWMIRGLENRDYSCSEKIEPAEEKGQNVNTCLERSFRV